MAENDHLRWMRINRELLINLPAGRYAVAWRNFVITLYEQIEHWMEQRRRDVRHTMWDFCVIHSCNKRDRVAAAEFKRLLETTLGIVGRTFGDIELGENTLEAASTMVTGSTKVFIIVSRYLDLQDYPKFVFQSALMEQLRRPDWRRKLVPLYLPGTRDNPPFLLANIQGLTLGNDPRTVELVSHDIPVDDQIRVRQQRQRAEANLREELRRGRAQRLSEIRDVVAELREQFGDNHDPTGALDQISEHLRTAVNATDGGGASQVINISKSTAVSVGPSFHISVNVQKDTPASSRPGTPFSEEDYYSCSDSLSSYS